jgi:hypothetical protein
MKMQKKKCLLILPRNIFPVIGGYSNHRKNFVGINSLAVIGQL